MFFLRVSHKFGPTDPFGHVAVSIVSFVLTVSCKWCGTARGGAGAHPGTRNSQSPGGPREYPPPHASPIWTCATTFPYMAIGTKQITTERRTAMTRLEEKLRRDVTEERKSDDDEGTCVAFLGVATGILPFHQDPLAIFHSYVGIKCPLQTSLPLSTQKLSQKVCQLLCDPHPLRFSFDHPD